MPRLNFEVQHSPRAQAEGLGTDAPGNSERGVLHACLTERTLSRTLRA